MNRRKFLIAVGFTSFSLDVARSQGAIKRIGVVMGTASTDATQNRLVDTFVGTLTNLGWEEDKTIQVERRWADGDPGKLAAQAEDLVALNPAIVFAQGTPALLALRKHTAT